MNTTTISQSAAAACVDHARGKATELGVPMSFAVVDTAGHLVHFERMDGASWMTITLASGKARAAAAFSMPTDQLAEMVGDAALFANSLISQVNLVPVPGGTVIMENGDVVGAIGASGGMPNQDMEAAQAGAATSAH